MVYVEVFAVSFDVKNAHPLRAIQGLDETIPAIRRCRHPYGIQQVRRTRCHRVRTIEPQNFITLQPMPTLLPPLLTAREII
jgi:hypothetical protein